MAAEEWERKAKRKGSLAEFFAASPLRDSGLVVERKKDAPRKIDLLITSSTPTSFRNGQSRTLTRVSWPGSTKRTRTGFF